MRALSMTGGPGSLTAMQAIKRAVFRWVFMALFLGLAPVSLALIGAAALGFAGPAARPVAAAGGVYLLGCFGVTVVFNVPMNERLAAMDPASATSQIYWTGTYLPRWTWWNTVRTVACALSAALLLIALASLSAHANGAP